MFITFNGMIRGCCVRSLHDCVRGLHAHGLRDHVRSLRDHVHDCVRDRVHIHDSDNLKCSNWSMIYV